LHFSSTTPPPPELYTLSLHDALPICRELQGAETIGFTAQTRMSGINIDGRQIRKGAASAIRAHVEAMGGVFPKEVTTTVEEVSRSEEHTSELQSRRDLVCRLLLEKKK